MKPVISAFPAVIPPCRAGSERKGERARPHVPPSRSRSHGARASRALLRLALAAMMERRGAIETSGRCRKSENAETRPAPQTERYSGVCGAATALQGPAVSKVNGETVVHTAEGCGLHLPVLDRVGIKTDAVVEAPLCAKATGTEVIHVHLAYVVGMEVDHLKERHSLRHVSSNTNSRKWKLIFFAGHPPATAEEHLAHTAHQPSLNTALLSADSGTQRDIQEILVVAALPQLSLLPHPSSSSSSGLHHRHRCRSPRSPSAQRAVPGTGG